MTFRMYVLFVPAPGLISYVSMKSKNGSGERINFRCASPHWDIFESGNSNPLLYSGLGNPKDRGAWWATYSLWGHKESDMTELTTHAMGLQWKDCT